MTPFTDLDRQAGRKAMEKALSPMQRAARRFMSGRPPATPQNTPLGAVMLATEQRKRLSTILAEEKGVVNGRITSIGVVIRFTPPVPNVPADMVLVKKNMEGQAVAFLEMYGSKFKKKFVIAGLLFAVQDSIEKRFFPYPIERTPEGEAALLWSSQRQISQKLPKGID